MSTDPVALAREARRLSAELGCEVTPHPVLAGRVEAREPVPGVYLLAGTPEEVLAEVKRLREDAA